MGGRHFQIHREHRVRGGMRRQRDQAGGPVHHGRHRRVVDGGRPQLIPRRQRHAQARVPPVFQEIPDIRHHLPRLGDAGGQGGAVHHLAERIALGEGTQRELQIKGARGVMIGGQHRGVKEQPVLGGRLAGFQRQQAGRNRHGFHLELEGADDDRVALLGLGVQRARPGEGQGLPLRFEGPLIGGQQRVGSRHRRVQLHQVAVGGFLPAANVPARKLHVVILGRQLHPERRHRRAGHHIVQHAAPVGDPLPDGEQVKPVRLHRLRQTLHPQGGRPGRITQPKGRLQPRHRLRKKRRGDFRQGLRTVRAQPKPGVGGHPHEAAHGFRPRHGQPRQRPVCFPQRLVPFQTHRDHLPARRGLTVHQPQLRGGRVRRLAQKIIAHARRRQFGNRIPLGHGQPQFAQWRLADVQFKLPVNRQLVFAKMIGEHLRHRHLRLDLIRLNPQPAIGAGKPINKALAAPLPEQGAGGVALRELFRGKLGQAGGLHHLQPHRPVIDDPVIAGKPRRPLRSHLHDFRRLRKRPQRTLPLHLQGKLVLLRLVEPDHQPPVRRIGHRLHLPGQNLIPLHAGHFTAAVQPQRQDIQLALHDLAGEQRRLGHQAGADADLRLHFRRIKQPALRLGPGLLPGKIDRAVHRQMAHEIAARPFHPSGPLENELRVRRQPLEDNGLQAAGRHPETHRVPVIGRLHGNVEPDFHRIHPAAVKRQPVAIVPRADAPLRMWPQPGEGHRTGQDRQRTTGGGFHPHLGGEGERGHLPVGQIPHQIEILQRDGVGRRRPDGQPQTGAQKGNDGFSIHILMRVRLLARVWPQASRLP